MTNRLHYGDNLGVLREHVPNESVDLVYLDPPFNSARSYNLLFKQVKGTESPAQIMAFEDTWTWSHTLYDGFKADTRNAPLWSIVAALYEMLGPSEMMAYLVMMAPRLVELRRVLKPTGSLYLHCDPTASHYLKVLLDQLFGPTNFRNEVIWKRNAAKGLASRRLARNHDVILAYTRTEEAHWDASKTFVSYEDDLPDSVKKQYASMDSEGRRYQLTSLLNPNANRPNLTYEFLGVTRVWRWTRDRMEAAYERGLIVQGQPGGVPRYKRYLDEQRGLPLDDVWLDVPNLQGASGEYRGYPTQKPLALLRRIIETSCPEGGTVLDPFCGCGTAVVQAERMGRSWIGIDITYLAINEVMSRLQEEKREGHPLVYELVGTPKDADAARALFEQTAHQSHKPYEQWAVSLIPGARWNEKKGADRGIDGRLTLWVGNKPKDALVQVKGGNGLNLSNVRDFAHVIAANNAPLGYMVSQKEPTREMRLVAEGMGRIGFGGTGSYPRYQLLTVREILEEGKTPLIPDGLLTVSTGGAGRFVDPNQPGFGFDS